MIRHILSWLISNEMWKLYIFPLKIFLARTECEITCSYSHICRHKQAFGEFAAPKSSLLRWSLKVPGNPNNCDSTGFTAHWWKSQLVLQSLRVKWGNILCQVLCKQELHMATLLTAAQWKHSSAHILFSLGFWSAFMKHLSSLARTFHLWHSNKLLFTTQFR